MSYNESLLANSNYPPMTQSQWDNAPFNEVDVPEKEFDVIISQSLSKETKVITNDYVPGASDVDYEPDDEGGYCSCGWHDPDDTSDTNWNKIYTEQHLTPLELIKKFKSLLMDIDSPELRMNPCFQRKQYYIDECSSWTDDETEIVLN